MRPGDGGGRAREVEATHAADPPPEAGPVSDAQAASGGVIWITGLSGVGKTTVAALVRERFARTGQLPVLLDGDRIRQVMPEPPGFGEADRRRLAHVYAGLAREFSAQGHLVVCATVSLFHAVHAWNRAHLPRYLEVWLRAPVEELRRRGVRPHLYGRHTEAPADAVGVATADGAGCLGEPGEADADDGGHAAHGEVVGRGIAAEYPLRPHLTVDTTTTGPARAADLIIHSYREAMITAADTAARHEGA